jgi:peptidoglycan/xylan/chitin deacetylase (PgdA/CDA1 family)
MTSRRTVDPRSPRRRAITLGLGLAVLAIAAAAAAWYVRDATRRGPQEITVTVTAPGVDRERVTVPIDADVDGALVRAGVQPHDGRLLSVRDRAVLDPRLDPARITLAGQPATAEFPLADGAHITVVDGEDAIEGTEVVQEVLPAPPLPDVMRHVHVVGRDGLVERTVGVRSGEIVDSEVLVEAVAPERTGRKVVALTFDDGPHETWTPQIQFLLRLQGVKATFCQLGERVERYPDLTRAVLADGHQLCNHTMTHPELAGAPTAQLDEEIGGGAKAFTDLGIDPVRYYRAPGGSIDDAVVARAREEGEVALGWSVDTRDWARGADLLSIVQNVEREVEPGAIILLHDGGGSTRQQTVDSTLFLLQVLRQQGYDFTFPLLPRND